MGGKPEPLDVLIQGFLSQGPADEYVGGFLFYPKIQYFTDARPCPYPVHLVHGHHQSPFVQHLLTFLADAGTRSRAGAVRAAS
jgi:hypothetical protein